MFKAEARYTGSDNQVDDFNDLTINKGFIQYSVIDDFSQVICLSALLWLDFVK